MHTCSKLMIMPLHFSQLHPSTYFVSWATNLFLWIWASNFGLTKMSFMSSAVLPPPCSTGLSTLPSEEFCLSAASYVWASPSLTGEYRSLIYICRNISLNEVAPSILKINKNSFVRSSLFIAQESPQFNYAINVMHFCRVSSAASLSFQSWSES